MADRPSRALLVPVGLVVLAGGLRLWGLDSPGRRYFDETYYVRDALSYLERGSEEGFAVHPPLGKWLIAAGIGVLGDDGWGWRTASALAGTLTVLVTYLLARRLSGSVAVAALAGLLVTVDGLAFTSSRIAMLDVFLGLFVVTAVWLVVEDARRRRRRPGGRWEAAIGSRWRWAAGLALGLAVATKWSGLLGVLACGLLVLLAEAALPSASGRVRLERVLAAAAGMAVSFLVLPFVVHLASYAGWFANYEESHAGSRACAEEPSCEPGVTGRLGTWWDVQGKIVRFQRDLEPTHSYRSEPASWPLLLRPVLQYRESCPASGPTDDRPCVVPPGQRAEILSLGNPALWWPALLAVPLLAWRAVSRRDANAAAVVVVLLSLWLPWLATGKAGYVFYLVPAVPFLALALAMALGGVQARSWRPRLLVGAGVLAVALFAFFHPVLTGAPLSPDEQDRRHWLSSWG